MIGQKRSLAVYAGLGLLVLLGAGAWAVPRAQNLAAGDVTTSATVDANRDKVFDSLEAVLGQAGTDAVDVIVLTTGPFDPQALERALGRVEVTHVFTVVPGFAARLTRAQVERLAREKWVRQIEHDAQVQAFLDNATRHFGAQQARQDFGVTGDRDGDPSTYTKDDVVVAVIDTGIDAAHRDLQGKVIAWKDWVNAREQPYDDHGHGTHVAGTVAGTGAANAAYRGVAPGAALVGLKVLNAQGSGSLSNVQAAVEWCIANQATFNIRILSMSLGTSGSSDGSDAVSQAVNKAVEAGIVAVVAAGNSGPASRTVGAPGAATGALTVGAMADPGEGGFYIAPFSSRGPTADGRTKPDIAAPGYKITAPKAGTTDQYTEMSGTSMATPFVSGTVALLLDANPGLTPDQVRQALAGTAQDWGAPGQDVDFGSGRLDVYAAVARASGRQGTGPAVAGHAGFQGSLAQAGQTAEHSFSVNDASWPVAVTLIMPGWTGSSSPDFDLFLYDPDGREVARSEGATRQETVTRPVTSTGVYTVKVLDYAGAGNYLVDVSAGLGEGGTPDPDPEPEPEPGQYERRWTGQVAPGAPNASFDLGVAAEGFVDLRLDWATTADLDLYVYAPDGRLAARAFTLRNPETLRLNTEKYGTGTYRLQVNLYSGVASDFTLLARGYSRTTYTGSVSSAQPDVRHTHAVGQGGLGRFTLSWDTTADLDFFVYGPDGRLRGRAYTLRNPEVLEMNLDTAGTWQVRVNLYSGPATAYMLKVFVPAPILS